MNSNKNILTIATGKKLYVDMAVNLARSYRLWNTKSDINFYIATDQPQFLPDDVKRSTKIIALQPGGLGEGFSPKLHLDKLAPEGQTLFIDSDCLIYGDLTPVFEKFKGHAVAVIGGYIADGEWFGDVKAICKNTGVRHLPKFNGGIYYLERGDKATKVYNLARELESKYDETGFVRLRGRPNDELLMALAMELNQQEPIADDGSILAEFVNFQSGIKSDLLKGSVEMFNDPKHPKYQQSWPLQKAKPLIVHFLGHHNQLMPYVKEVKKLKYLFENGSSKTAAKLLTFLQVTLPFGSISFTKNVLRPVYHAIFGARKIRRSERIAE